MHDLRNAQEKQAAKNSTYNYEKKKESQTST